MSSGSHTARWSRSDWPEDRPRFAEPSATFERMHDLLGRKWHLQILHRLHQDGPSGFSRLKESVDGISSKMLSESLSSLETQGVVERTVVNDQPVRVEYSLTDGGEAFEDVLTALIRWDHEHGLSEEDG